jgi:hypothetical protein
MRPLQIYKRNLSGSMGIELLFGTSFDPPLFSLVSIFSGTNSAMSNIHAVLIFKTCLGAFVTNVSLDF